MLRFSEGPRARAISASSIPVAECQVPFVSLSFTRDTYRASKRLKDEERRNGRSWRKTRGSPERKRRRPRKKRERDEKKRKPKEGRRSQVLKDGPKAFCLNLTRRGNASLLLSALLFLLSSSPFPFERGLKFCAQGFEPFHALFRHGSRVDRSDSPEFFEFRSWVLSGGEEVNCVFKYA